MKMPEKIDSKLLAPCGVNCISCQRYLNPCAGCLIGDDGKNKASLKCKIKNCFDGKKVITGEKGAVYAEPSFPKNENNRSRIPTEKEIRDAIADHLYVIYKGVRKREIDYYFFEDDE